MNTDILFDAYLNGLFHGVTLAGLGVLVWFHITDALRERAIRRKNRLLNRAAGTILRIR